MRARMIFTVVAILLVSGFVALNWGEVIRTAPLSFGLAVIEAPIGLILVATLLALVIAFVASSAVTQTRYLLDSRQYAKELQAQRELADKAEASRFSELRQQIDANQRETRQREAIVASEIEKSLVSHQRETRAQLEQLGKSFGFQMAEMENRLLPRAAERREPVTKPLPHM